MVLTRVRKDVAYISKTHDEKIADNRRRIDKLEDVQKYHIRKKLTPFFVLDLAFMPTSV